MTNKVLQKKLQFLRQKGHSLSSLSLPSKFIRVLCKMMELLTTFLILSALVCCKPTSTARRCQAVPSNDVNVMNFGAVGDGETDDSQAFLKAWAAICQGNTNAPILLIPEGRTFLLMPVKFEGPCKPSSINVQISGNITAPSLSSWNGLDLQSWIIFSNVNGLTLNGNGQIDGQGSTWWRKVDTRPSALNFLNCSNLQISGLSLINSPRGHVCLTECNGVTISNLRITAPEESPNTDGIDMGRSTNVQINHCNIGTGAYGKTDTVEEVRVINCGFTGTTNGARIKTWQGGSGYARKISFEGITLDNVQNPIIIDQYYCDHQHECKNQTSAVQISDIYYIGVNGTSSTDKAIQLSCSESVACTNIMLDNINITSANPGQTTRASCDNAHGRDGVSIPAVDCLLP